LAVRTDRGALQKAMITPVSTLIRHHQTPHLRRVGPVSAVRTARALPPEATTTGVVATRPRTVTPTAARIAIPTVATMVVPEIVPAMVPAMVEVTAIPAAAVLPAVVDALEPEIPVPQIPARQIQEETKVVTPRADRPVVIQEAAMVAVLAVVARTVPEAKPKATTPAVILAAAVAVVAVANPSLLT